MLDFSPIASAIKAVHSPPPQAQPSVAKEMKPVPETEIQAPVPPPPKGSGPGLGERFDHYDNQVPPNPPKTKEARAEQITQGNVPIKQAQEEVSREIRIEYRKKEPKSKLELLGRGTGLPQPTTEPARLKMPFLNPLGRQSLGSSIDARI